MASSIHGTGWCAASLYVLTEMLLFFLQMNDCKNLEICLSMQRDCIIKRFWVQKKSTQGKKLSIFLNAHSEQEMICCSVSRVLLSFQSC